MGIRARAVVVGPIRPGIKALLEMPSKQPIYG